MKQRNACLTFHLPLRRWQDEFEERRFTLWWRTLFCLLCYELEAIGAAHSECSLRGDRKGSVYILKKPKKVLHVNTRKLYVHICTNVHLVQKNRRGTSMFSSVNTTAWFLSLSESFFHSNWQVSIWLIMSIILGTSMLTLLSSKHAPACTLLQKRCLS